MLEEKIDLLIKAIDQNTLALINLRTGAAAEKKEKKADPKPEPVKAAPAIEASASTLTIADVRTAAQKLLDAGRVDLIRPLLSKYAVEKISAVDPTKYAEVIADLTAALAKANEGGVV